MQATISITNKWQVHIPKAARKALGIKKPGMMEIKAKNGALILTPAKKSILNYAGKYHYLLNKKNKKINIDKVRDYIDYSNL
ncbi:AbrB/MazE/SpoVT family DNA-binding domain-containing protein [Candidatus Daviesbacteria bacterium]|nr:AbrB/MazE/SpoVT family DNA-binding domain-containing protein [Candidatus Daviesbacteria bacterium]MBI4038474.1 AbrB/MazE/SpoVT family DNA-binding domain-containing protein [Candidatus Daviesbacteria bacterium]